MPQSDSVADRATVEFPDSVIDVEADGHRESLDLTEDTDITRLRIILGLRPVDGCFERRYPDDIQDVSFRAGIRLIGNITGEARTKLGSLGARVWLTPRNL